MELTRSGTGAWSLLLQWSCLEKVRSWERLFRGVHSALVHDSTPGGQHLVGGICRAEETGLPLATQTHLGISLASAMSPGSPPDGAQPPEVDRLLDCRPTQWCGGTFTRRRLVLLVK